MKYSAKDIAAIVRKTRTTLGVTQQGLALTSGTGTRFIIDLEKGKETCELGKVLTVLHTLGIKLALTTPSIPSEETTTAHGKNAGRLSPQ
jgi:HTH-type transcriptional regulator/antitoxin HipB